MLGATVEAGAAVVGVVVVGAVVVVGTTAPGGKTFIVTTRLRGSDPLIGSIKAPLIALTAPRLHEAGAFVTTGTTKLESVTVAVFAVALYFTPPELALLRCATVGPIGQPVETRAGMSMRVSDEPVSVTRPVSVLIVPVKLEVAIRWTVTGTVIVNDTAGNVMPDFGKVRFPLPSDVPTNEPVNAMVLGTQGAGVHCWRWNVAVACTVTLPAGRDVDGTVVVVVDAVVVVVVAADAGFRRIADDAATSVAAPITDIKRRRPRVTRTICITLVPPGYRRASDATRGSALEIAPRPVASLIRRRSGN